MTLGLLHRKRAAELLAQASGNPDSPAFKQCAAELSRAAGIFEYAASQPLAAWSGSLVTIEMLGDFHSAFATLSLLEAQELVVRKGFATGVGQSLFAKLTLEIARKAGAVLGLVSAIVKQAEATTGEEPRLSALCWYLTATSAVFRGLAMRALGNEKYAAGQPGPAVAYLLAASLTPEEEKTLVRNLDVVPSIPFFRSDFVSLLSNNNVERSEGESCNARVPRDHLCNPRRDKEEMRSVAEGERQRILRYSSSKRISRNARSREF